MARQKSHSWVMARISKKPITRLFIFTVALALRSRGLVIGSREKEEREREEREREEREREEKEEKNLQIAIRCLWDLFD